MDSKELPLVERVAELEGRLAELDQLRLALTESERRLASIAENAPDYILEMDRDGRLTYINRPAPGHRLEDMIGTDVERWMEEPYRASFRAALAEVLATGEDREYESVASVSGRYYVCRIRAIADGGPISRAILVTHDVTERREAEERLRESEARFRALVEGAFEGLLISVDARVVEANEAFARMFGYARDELPGLTPSDLATEESARLVMEHIRSGDETGYEIVGRRKDGRTFPVEILGRNSVYRGQPARVSAFRDLTERRRLEESFFNAQKLESLGILAGGIAHDFNNLLFAIDGSAELAEGEVEAGTTVARHLGTIRTAAEQAAALTRQMLTYAGRDRFAVRPIDVDRLLAGMARLLDASIPKSARLSIRPAGGLPPIDGDAGRLRQVLLNLVTNAAEALGGEPGTVVIETGRTSVDRETLRGAYVTELPVPCQAVHIVVEDDGQGIDPEAMARIFDPFYSTRFPGRGLGLAAVLGIVRGHRGAIAVDSRPGEGSRFTLLFSPSTGSPDLEEDGGEVAATDCGRGRRALVVDDEPAGREVAREFLGSIGFEVVTVAGGAEALDRLSSGPAAFDVCILDLLMPGLDGRQTLRGIRDLGARLPVLLATGHVEPRDLLEDESLQPCRALAKPYRLGQLRLLVEEVLPAAEGPS